MGTALFTAVSGLQVHQLRLDVIANNIANVNTTGFRGSRALFQEQISQTLAGASPPTATTGGTNPVQVGLGAVMASIDIDFTQGSLLTTGFASDLAIQGRGFFVLSDGTGAFYTRDGSFQLNADGELVDPATGLWVQGYLADASGVVDVDAGLTNIVVPLGGSAFAQATENVYLIGNLDSQTASTSTVVRTVRVFDSLGTERDIEVTFTKTANPNEWTWSAATSDPEVNSITGSGTITFNTDGSFNTATSTTISVDFTNTNPSLPVDPLVFDLDFGPVTQLSGLSDIVVQSQDGLAPGTLETFNVGRDGSVTGIFSNGLTRVLGQIALATFSNDGGLIRFGRNLFVPSNNSGLPQVGTPMSGGRGEVTGGVLEASNVDLGTEFSNLIITQRGFQANARTITTADTLLQETVNLIR
jgi:flagellar hook protein FlgE